MRQNSEFMQTGAEERLMEMKVIGITGGVGSGKSRVLAYLEDVYGAVICQMDETARALQEKEPGVLIGSWSLLEQEFSTGRGNWTGQLWEASYLPMKRK